MDQPAGDAASSLPQAPAPDMGAEPPMPEGPEPPMDDMGGGEGGGEIQSMFDGLNQEHQKAAKRYIQSLEDQETEQVGAGGDMDMGAQPPMDGGQTPMQESVIFTKAQLKKINESIGGMEDELSREKELKHTTKTKDDKNKPVSPFDPPRKNRK